jgi:hypothetical protein
MKRALCAILFTFLVSPYSQAGYVGQINLSSGSGALGSLGTMGPQGTGSTGANSYVVGTNLAAFSVTSASGTMTTLTGGFLDFNTGIYTGTDANGVVHYAAGGNFFVLENPVFGSQPVYARDNSTGAATVTSLGINSPAGDAEYELTMSFSTANLLSPISDAFGASSPGLYMGTVSFIFVNDSNLAGAQLLGGSITFTTVPEPSSLVMVVIGGVGLLGFGGRRLRKVRQAS